MTETQLDDEEAEVWDTLIQTWIKKQWVRKTWQTVKVAQRSQHPTTPLTTHPTTTTKRNDHD